MTEKFSGVKPKTFAPLQNIAGAMELAYALINRGPETPNLGVIYGHSGLGKSYASLYVQNKTNAARVEVGDSWNKKTLVSAILSECQLHGIRGCTADLTREAINRLGELNFPLIIDEADKLVDKGYIETVREIAEAAKIPVILIGEELLPRKLERIERVHNRVLKWYGAVPCDLEDARHLANLFLHATIDDALLDDMRIACGGRARRIVVNIDRMNDYARDTGVQALTRETYAQNYYTGASPSPRSGRLNISRVKTTGGARGTAV